MLHNHKQKSTSTSKHEFDYLSSQTTFYCKIKENKWRAKKYLKNKNEWIEIWSEKRASNKCGKLKDSKRKTVFVVNDKNRGNHDEQEKCVF